MGVISTAARAAMGVSLNRIGGRIPTTPATPSYSGSKSAMERAWSGDAMRGGLNGAYSGVKAQGYGGGRLPTVNDPEKALADLSMQKYNDFVQNFGAFEKTLIDRAQTDTSLIDQAYSTSRNANMAAEGTAARNAQRLGIDLTQTQDAELTRQRSRTNTLNTAHSVNNARLGQEDANQALLSGLIDIGNSVSSTAMQGLGQAATSAANRRNAYKNAKTQGKVGLINFAGDLGSSIIGSI